jgi:hypothetical protein
MLADLVRAQVPPISTDVVLVRAQVRTVPLDVLAVLTNVRLVTRDIALLAFPCALLGVFMLQSPIVGTQVRTITLQILAVRPDVRAVVTDVTAVVGQICVTLVWPIATVCRSSGLRSARSRLRIRLLIVCG